MSISFSVPYSDFQTQDNTLTQDGGSWLVQTSNKDMECWSGSRSRGFCADHGCLPCSIPLASSVLSYNVKYITNVSIPMPQYGNANTVDFTFGYNFYWASDKTQSRTPLSTQVTIGSSSITDNFGAVNPDWLWYTLDTSLDDPFTHSGTTTMLKSQDGSTGYIQITIDFSFSRQPGSTCMWYLIGRRFDISTPSSIGTAPLLGSGSSSRAIASASMTSTPTTETTTGVITGTPTRIFDLLVFSIILPGLSAQSVSTGNIPGQSSIVSFSLNPGQEIPTSAVIGGAMGAVLLLGIVALILFLVYRRKKRKKWMKEQENLTQNAVVGGYSGERDATQTPSTITRRRLFFRYYLSPPSEEIRTSSQFGAVDSRSNRTSKPIPTPPQPNPIESNHEVPRTNSRQRGRRRRDYRQQPSMSSTIAMDIPPPAYSDIDGTTEFPDRQAHEGEDGDLDDEENEIVEGTSGRTSIRAPVLVLVGDNRHSGDLSEQSSTLAWSSGRAKEKHWSSSRESSVPPSSTTMTPSATSMLSSVRDSHMLTAVSTIGDGPL
ncbi:hypothetical protein FRC19_004056 [Serendipita sp. 401]|nr:hypothetical protein FRC19_004056 [Serendipita sp. 401]KAG8837170.1 hypothetical protein FRC18_009894 [Serendipita sp. 400]KAG9054254.1 hypothetical protein FS842_005655 [Serendipita sp. 407]